MNREAEDYAALIGELNLAWDHIRAQFEANRRATRRMEAAASDEFAWAALGYTLHNLYNAVENYFLRIAKFFENRLDSSSWHRELAERMIIPIEGLRPALLPREMLPDIHELRSFRHVFRNIYAVQLDPERVQRVNERVRRVVDGFEQAHGQFIAKLREIRDGLASGGES